MPKRKSATHKGDYGRVLIAAGSKGMTGAAVLASRGAHRTGVGLTYLAVPKPILDYVDAMTPEIITLPFADISKIKADAYAIGPGLGVSSGTKQLVSKLAAYDKPLVIDADALNVIAKAPGLIKKAKADIIMTPHPGEMARLIKKSTIYVQANRLKVAWEAAKKFKCVMVLKGSRTVVADAHGKTFINNTGNPGMASAGVGDILTGMIAGLAAQGLSAWDAAVVGVYLHGLAGDLADKDKGEYGMIASDVVEKIPYAIQRSR